MVFYYIAMIIFFAQALHTMHDQISHDVFTTRKSELDSFDHVVLKNIPCEIHFLQKIPCKHQVRLQGPKKIIEALQLNIKDKTLTIEISADIIIPKELENEFIKCHVYAPESLNFSTDNSPRCKFYGFEEKNSWCSIS